jgi:hypothetical protein
MEKNWENVGRNCETTWKKQSTKMGGKPCKNWGAFG